MTYIKVNDTLYPSYFKKQPSIAGKYSDKDWTNRESRSFSIEIDYQTAVTTFVDGVKWSIVDDVLDDTGTEVVSQVEMDCSEFWVAGVITDTRNGRMTITMGKPTDKEALAAVTAAYTEGVNSI